LELASQRNSAKTSPTLFHEVLIRLIFGSNDGWGDGIWRRANESFSAAALALVASISPATAADQPFFNSPSGVNRFGRRGELDS
jgi:hypothetical protein